jgi:hypothetical protein
VGGGFAPKIHILFKNKKHFLFFIVCGVCRIRFPLRACKGNFTSLPGGCVKSIFSALRAKLKFETDVFFMILRSKIMKNTSVSKENSAAEGGKTFLHNPRLVVTGFS